MFVWGDKSPTFVMPCESGASVNTGGAIFDRSVFTGSPAFAANDAKENVASYGMKRRTLALILSFWIALPASAANLAERMQPCLACHGEKGQSETPEIPSLGAQPAGYTLIQLYLFREKQRKIEVMNEYAKDLSDDDLRQFSDAIAKLPAPAPEGAVDAGRMERGYALIERHHCNQCHQSNLAGRDNVPRIAAQREDYLARALREYKSNARVGYEPIMLEVMRPLSDADITELAYTIAHMK
jgi:cytochrome c553